MPGPLSCGPRVKTAQPTRLLKASTLTVSSLAESVHVEAASWSFSDSSDTGERGNHQVPHSKSSPHQGPHPRNSPHPPPHSKSSHRGPKAAPARPGPPPNWGKAPAPPGEPTAPPPGWDFSPPNPGGLDCFLRRLPPTCRIKLGFDDPIHPIPWGATRYGGTR